MGLEISFFESLNYKFNFLNSYREFKVSISYWGGFSFQGISLPCLNCQIYLCIDVPSILLLSL